MALLLGACRGKEPAAATSRRPVPEVRIGADDPRIAYRGDRLLLGRAPFSGWLVERYDGGPIKSLTPYLDGRVEGTMIGWYTDGVRMFERSYSAGRREGLHVGWWENGRLRFRYRFHGDLQQGLSEELYEDGRPRRLFHYRDGAEEGSQRMWDEDGALYANYVVIAGRRYGSIGSKPCYSAAGDRIPRVGETVSPTEAKQ